MNPAIDALAEIVIAAKIRQARESKQEKSK